MVPERPSFGVLSGLGDDLRGQFFADRNVTRRAERLAVRPDFDRSAVLGYRPANPDDLPAARKVADVPGLNPEDSPRTAYRWRT